MRVAGFSCWASEREDAPVIDVPTGEYDEGSSSRDQWSAGGDETATTPIQPPLTSPPRAKGRPTNAETATTPRLNPVRSQPCTRSGRGRSDTGGWRRA